MSRTRTGGATVGERHIETTRLVDAPRTLVFKVWTNARDIGSWWGPRGFTTTTHSMDVKPGGVWSFIMHAPDGTDYDNFICYREVVANERLIYDHGERENEPPLFHVTVRFAEEGNRTRITMRLEFASAEACREKVEFGAVEGGQQTLDRLEEYLAGNAQQESPTDEGVELLMSRVVDAPRALVFKVMTEARHFSQWFGPHGFTIPHCTMDARPGGKLHFAHLREGGKAVFTTEGKQMSAGGEVWVCGVFHEVVPNERIVFSVGFSDEEGNVVERPGFSRESLIEFTLSDRGKKTEIVLRHTGLRSDQGESEGWKQGLQRLETYLAEIQQGAGG